LKSNPSNPHNLPALRTLSLRLQHANGKYRIVCGHPARPSAGADALQEVTELPEKSIMLVMLDHIGLAVGINNQRILPAQVIIDRPPLTVDRETHVERPAIGEAPASLGRH